MMLIRENVGFKVALS